MKWKKLKPLEGRINPCLCCPPIEAKACLKKIVAVGFGAAFLSRDGQVVVDGEEIYSKSKDGKRLFTFRRAENMAAKDPNHDWRIVLHGPLHGETYQRQGEKTWLLVEKNQGFA
jgi:hypothetical protein